MKYHQIMSPLLLKMEVFLQIVLLVHMVELYVELKKVEYYKLMRQLPLVEVLKYKIVVLSF